MTKGAGVVLGGGLSSETSFGAVRVEIAVVIHRFLKTVTLPSEDIITMSSGSTMRDIRG